jgi:hypothetical protein
LFRFLSLKFGQQPGLMQQFIDKRPVLVDLFLDVFAFTNVRDFVGWIIPQLAEDLDGLSGIAAKVERGISCALATMASSIE